MIRTGKSPHTCTMTYLYFSLSQNTTEEIHLAKFNELNSNKSSCDRKSLDPSDHCSKDNATIVIMIKKSRIMGITDRMYAPYYLNLDSITLANS